MDENTKISQKSIIRSTEIPGLAWRGFQGEADYPHIFDLIHGSREFDGLDRGETLEDVANNYTHLFHCDPYKDMLFAEVEGKAVAYCRVWWAVEGSGQWVGFQLGIVLPEWRRKGIGTRLLRFCEERLGQIANELIDGGSMPGDTPCIMDNYASRSEMDKINLLERRGYTPARYTYQMVRPNLENIPDLPLPPGVEVRLALPEHYRMILDASNEGFRDHWGYIPDPWEDFDRMLHEPDSDPSLWRVAWQGDQIAGMVLSFINTNENRLYNRKRGYTENICVLRPWRRQGLAKALIARSLLGLKERGMTEASLGVDTQNTSGALNLYKTMGYEVVKGGIIFRKPLKRRNVRTSKR